MNYITPKEAAAKWNVANRRMLQYCNESRIFGAEKLGNFWLIPKDTKKPVDRQATNGRKKRM